MPLLFVAGTLGALAGFYLSPEVRPLALIGARWIAGAGLIYLAFFRSAPVEQHPSTEAS